MRGNIMKNTVKIELNFDEIQVLQGLIYEYYQTLKQPHMCEVEKMCEKTITYKLNEAETEIFSK